MLSLFILVAHLVALLILTPCASAESCWKDCLEAQKVDCASTDLACHCTASSGTYLSSVILCARTNCNPSIDVELLLAPFISVCGNMGQPIPAPALSITEQNSMLDNVLNTDGALSPTLATVPAPTTHSRSLVTQIVTLVVTPVPNSRALENGTIATSVGSLEGGGTEMTASVTASRPGETDGAQTSATIGNGSPFEDQPGHGHANRVSWRGMWWSLGMVAFVTAAFG